ncbi:RICIN domain-containing protein [Streptomyces ovatisporus]|uniref:RICIN domain-containing protein n=1 Tax=Streptomyces ovatisporus TaxID=1128682 RepID=A0ABV9A831_9ACTN
MPTLRSTAIAASTGILALSGLVATSAAPASAEPGSRDLINKKDGSRLALVDNNTAAEGAFANSLRNPGWKYSTEEWTSQLVSDGLPDGTHRRVLRNVAADKCLQPQTNTPERGTRIVVKTCNGSDIQKWNLQPETVGGTNSGWWIWRPVVNTKLAMTIDAYGNGSWNTLYLDTSYPSSDRLWALRPNDQPWPN